VCVCCYVPVVGKAAEFVIRLEYQVLRTVLQLFSSQFDAFTVHATQFPLLQSSNQTDEQKIPDILLSSAEMMDRFKKLMITCVNFVLFSG